MADDLTRKRPAAWYDEQFRVGATVEDYATGFYRFIDRAVISMVMKVNPVRIIELAAGSYRLALFALSQCPTLERFTWTDFSEVCRQQCAKHLFHSLKCQMKLLDIDKDFKEVSWKEFDTVVCTALEHLEHDVEIIKSLPRGMNVFLALPNFTSMDHIRVYPNPHFILQRYKKVLRISEWRAVSLGSGEDYQRYETFPFPQKVLDQRSKFLIRGVRL